MDEMEQIEAIWEKGVTLGYREDDEYKYELLHIDGFYVELKNRKESTSLLGLRTFRTTTGLEPYLDKIDIPKSGE
jgi:hypothetical protein